MVFEEENKREQKDSDLNKLKSWISKSTRLTSVNFDAEIHAQAKNFNLSLREAIEFGVLFKIADKEGNCYPECNLLNKLEKFVNMFNAKSDECEALRKQINHENIIVNKTDAIKEADNILSGEIIKND